MSWFETLTGVRESSPSQVREHIALNNHTLRSRVNGRTFHCGRLDTPSLAELRDRGRSNQTTGHKITLREVIGDTRNLHADVTNSGSLFQVASQFNLLEMVSPHVTPEDGIGIYENDHTQGPACAIACGAGTIYRNYFVPVNGHTGQSSHNQIDCLGDIGRHLGNGDHRLWQMRNGYALATVAGLREIADRIQSATEFELEHLRQQLRIGVHWDTQVTQNGCQHQVTQAFCSALPVAYSDLDTHLWEPFARLILEASYEATFWAAILNAQATGQKKLFLTLLGGGAFGNEMGWIIDAIRRSADLFSWADLDVAIVCYGHSNPHVQKLVGHLSGR